MPESPTQPGGPPQGEGGDDKNDDPDEGDKTRTKTMAMTEYECRFASEMPFVGRRYAYDPDEEKYSIRLYEGRLQVNPEMMFADLSTPNGIQVLWAHGSFWGDAPAVGRVLSMEFGKKELLGTIGIHDEMLRQFVAAGVACLDDAINRGLSVGLNFLDNPPITWEMGKGTREKPDKMTFGAVRVGEVSLTPMPRIGNAGIMAKIGGEEPPDEPPDDDGDPDE